MPQLVVLGAMLKCSFGAAPASLLVLPKNMVMGSMVPAATIMDHLPMVNIPTFGMCSQLNQANPAVAALTAAAMGTPTPAPCIPLITAPWSPGSATIKIGNFPALNSTSVCNCQWAGVIQITNPGQTTINTD